MHITQEAYSVPERSMAKYDREQLYADVWSMPRWKAAKKNGMTEDTLGSVCQRLYIPSPGLGHWSKVAAGRPTEAKPPLPSVTVRALQFTALCDSEVSDPIEASKACTAASWTVGYSKVPSRLNARYSRERLYEQVWASPMRSLARAYGVSDSALRKACCRLLVPVPPRGYWNKFAAGRELPTRPNLPRVQVANSTPGTKISTAEELTSLLKRIARDIATGHTLAAACRRAGISDK
jgi:hypothetical protein